MTNNKTNCNICPRNCLIAEGETGFCKVRKNQNGKILSTVYGNTTGLAIDPIEKKPLYHFYPSSKILSFGTFGCNMGCNYCENHHMSKHEQNYSLSQTISPKVIAETAIKYNCKSVAFTYNDPTVFIEYAADTAKICKAEGIKTVAVTAGYINPEPAKEFYKLIDAANIDLKGFSEEFYRKNCLAELQPVLDTIKYVTNETDCIVELTTLLIEGENDGEEDLKRQFDWILKNIGDEIPIHLSAFHPDYKMTDKQQTSLRTLLFAYNLAKSFGLKHVYTGNIPHIESSTTVCPICKRKLIERNGYETRILAIHNGKCTNCGNEIYGKF